MSEVSPCAVDWKRVRPRNPVNVKPMKLKPAALPRFSCRVPPSRKIIANGNITAATSRPGSRINFNKSRPAIAPTAFISFIAGRQDSEIRVLQGRGLGPKHGERLVDPPYDLMRRAAVELYHEGAVFAERDLHREQPAPQSRAVIGVDIEPIMDELPFDVARRAQRNDAPVVEYADPVGLFGLAQLVRGEADRDVVAPPQLADVLPKVATAD